MFLAAAPCGAAGTCGSRWRVVALAVSQELHVDRTLYSLVFGESVLNDAVAIVLYHTLLQFETTPVSLSSVIMGVLFFAENFVGSMFIGSTIGVLSALLFKHVRITVGCLLCRAGGDAMPW